MTRVQGGGALMLATGEYKPGDLPPPGHGYIEMQEWAEVQYKAKLRQNVCSNCCRWKFPQELSHVVIKTEYRTRRSGRGQSVTLESVLCLECEARRVKP